VFEFLPARVTAMATCCGDLVFKTPRGPAGYHTPAKWLVTPNSGLAIRVKDRAIGAVEGSGIYNKTLE